MKQNPWLKILRKDRLFTLFLVAMVLFPVAGCALFATPPEDISSVRTAVRQLDDALERSDALHEKSLRQFRDQLQVRWFEAIDQASLDDLNKAAADGLTVEEVEAIQKAAATARAEALVDIDRAFEAGRDPQIRKDLRTVYGALRAYILSKMSAEAVKQEMLDQVEGLARTAGVIE
jgi:hypothetical protein